MDILMLVDKLLWKKSERPILKCTATNPWVCQHSEKTACFPFALSFPVMSSKSSRKKCRYTWYYKLINILPRQGLFKSYDSFTNKIPVLLAVHATAERLLQSCRCCSAIRLLLPVFTSQPAHPAGLFLCDPVPISSRGLILSVKMFYVTTSLRGL